MKFINSALSVNDLGVHMSTSPFDELKNKFATAKAPATSEPSLEDKIRDRFSSLVKAVDQFDAVLKEEDPNASAAIAFGPPQNSDILPGQIKFMHPSSLTQYKAGSIDFIIQGYNIRVTTVDFVKSTQNIRGIYDASQLDLLTNDIGHYIVKLFIGNT